jgi:hypothetical protein
LEGVVGFKRYGKGVLYLIASRGIESGVPPKEQNHALFLLDHVGWTVDPEESIRKSSIFY